MPFASDCLAAFETLGRTDGRTDERTDGRTDGWTDGRTDVGTYVSTDLTVLPHCTRAGAYRSQPVSDDGNNTKLLFFELSLRKLKLYKGIPLRENAQRHLQTNAIFTQSDHGKIKPTHVGKFETKTQLDKTRFSSSVCIKYYVFSLFGKVFEKGISPQIQVWSHGPAY